LTTEPARRKLATGNRAVQSTVINGETRNQGEM
jgi:hypothetical protein